MKKARFGILSFGFALFALGSALPAQDQDKDRQAKIEKALKNLKSADASVRGTAAWALGWMRAEYAKDVAALLKDAEALVRGEAAGALGQMGAKEYAEDVAALLKDAEADVRGAAAEALGKLISKDEKEGVERYGKELGKLLDDRAECLIFDFAKRDWKNTTVSAVAEQVLKEWGLDPEKLKEKI